jgi:hypothetical protein
MAGDAAARARLTTAARNMAAVLLSMIFKEIAECRSSNANRNPSAA